MHPTFLKKLSFVVQITNVGAQKIDGTTLKIYRIVVAAFSVTDQADRVRFFQKTFLMANTSSDMILKMPFFILSNANINFLKKKL